MSFKKLFMVILVFQLAMLSSILPAMGETAEEWINYGNTFYTQGNYSEAIRYYDAALGIEPNNLKAWFNKANSLYMLGRYKEAIECYDKVLFIEPGNQNAMAYKSKAQEALALNPEDPNQTQEADNIIEPGRVGPFRYGLALADVKAALGEPSKIEDDKNAACVICHYSSYGVILYFSGGVSLSSIVTTSYSYQTRDGYKVGSRISDIRKTCEGQEIMLKETTQYNYIKNVVPNAFGVYLAYSGIKFIFDVSYNVIAIEV